MTPENKHTHCPVCGFIIVVGTESEDAECPNCTYQFRTPLGRIKDALEVNKLETENEKLRDVLDSIKDMVSEVLKEE